MFIDGPQLDLGVGEGNGHLPQQWAQVGLEFGLGRRVTMHVMGTRFQPASAEPSQVTPPQLPADLTAEAVTKPGGHGSPASVVAIWVRSGHSRPQLHEVWDRQLRPPSAQRVTPVPHAVRSVRVVALGDLADPIRPVARNGGHSSRRHAASQQPEEAQWLRSTGSAAARYRFGSSSSVRWDVRWMRRGMPPFYNFALRRRIRPGARCGERARRR